jgi:hypothetical protein
MTTDRRWPSSVFVLVFLAVSSIAMAAPYTVQITEIEMNNNSLYIDGSGNPQPVIVVRGVFTPALPCTQQGFFLLSTDPLFQHTLAILLAAKAAGTNVGFTHVYCFANGYSRGSTYSTE